MKNSYIQNDVFEKFWFEGVCVLPDGREVKWEEYRKEFAYAKGNDCKLNMSIGVINVKNRRRAKIKGYG